MRGLFAESERALSRQAFRQLRGELPHRRAVLRAEGREVLHHQPAGQRHEAEPDDAHAREVQRLAERAGLLPGLRLLRATDEQEVARAVADDQRAEVVERQHRLPVAERAGAERQVERHHHGEREKAGMRDAEEEVRDEGAGGAHVTEAGRPADAEQRERQKRGEREQEDAAFRAEEQAVLLRAEFGLEQFAELEAELRRGGERVEQVEQQARAAPRGELAEEAEVEEREALHPYERDEQERREADHRPVVREAEAAREGEAGEPFVILREAEFQQAPDGGGEKQEVERLAGGGGGVLPEAELQAGGEHGEERRKPVGRQVEQAGAVAQAGALVARAVLRQQRDAASQEREREGGAQGGEGVEGGDLRAGGENLHWQREQVIERAADLGIPPVPAEDVRGQSERRQRDPARERGEVKHQRGGSDGPRQDGTGEGARRSWFVIHAGKRTVCVRDIRGQPGARQGSCGSSSGRGGCFASTFSIGHLRPLCCSIATGGIGIGLNGWRVSFSSSGMAPRTDCPPGTPGRARRREFSGVAYTILSSSTVL